jgi:hypothetical protein
MEISDALWEALELMSREMSVDKDALVNQALFTFARFNGYVTPGSVAPHAQPAAPSPAASAVPPVAQPLASPPSAVRRAQEGAPAPQTPAPPPAEHPSSRMATGAAPAITRKEPPTQDEASPAPASDDLAPTMASPAQPPPPSSFEPTMPRGRPAVEPRPPPAAAAPADPEPPEPSEDEPLDDGLEALPENGAVEWKVPPHILADRAIKVVKGTVKGRDFQGVVQLLDAAGATLRNVDLGGPVDDAMIESVLADEVRDAKAWRQLKDQLAKEHHVGAATLALARAVGAGESVQLLQTWLAEHTLVRKSRAAHERAQKASFVLSNMNRFGAPPPRKASFLVEELLQGAFPASILRELSIDQDQFASSKAAADLIRAAKALNPEEKAYYAYTQALIEMSLGNPDASRVCADELRERSEEQADFLTTYLHGLFPTWNFWPAADPVATIKFSGDAKPGVRKLADFRNAIQKTAARVRTVRDLLLKLVPETTPWLPPSVDAILSRGKVTLTDAEELQLEEWQQRSIPQLLRFAHNEWARLTWLCWLAGLDAVGVPSATSKPRSPTMPGRAHALRSQLFVIKAEDGSFEEHVPPNDQADAKIVGALAWGDTTPNDIDPANASELGVPETMAILQAFGWASHVEVESPFAQPEADDEDEDEDGGGENEDGEENEHGEDDDRPSATEATPLGEGTSELGAEPEGTSQDHASLPEVNEPPAEPSERTAIVKPTGKKIWVQREGHAAIELEGVRFTVGRDPRCEIVIPSPRVSREHAAVIVDGDGVLVTDLNSSNGTFFNGQRVMKHIVSDGDVVQFGNEKITFRLTDPAV